MNALSCIPERAKVAAKDAPFEFELRVSHGSLEIWRFCEEYHDRKACRFRQLEGAKLRKRGQKFPKRWACRFNAYALMECGVLEEQE